MRTKVPKAPLISAVARAFSVVDRLSRERSGSLEEISRKTHLAKPTVYRFLLTLQALGYVRRDERDQWAITLKLFNTGSRALDHLDLYSAARPVAHDLADQLGETVHMGVLEAEAAVYVLKIESKFTIRMFSRVGRRIPLHCTAIGKVLLAFANPNEQATALKRLDFVGHTSKTIGSRSALETELARIRARGYAVDDEEHEEGIRCIGAPVFDHSNNAVAALSVSWPTFRAPPGGAEGVAAQVMAAAARVSSILGRPTD